MPPTQKNYGYNPVNWGNWQSLPDYREGWQDKNKSAIGRILKMDPTSKWNPVSKTLHEGEDRILTGVNRVLAPVLQFESQTVGQADPIRQTLSKIAPETHKQYQDWWNNHGADVAGIAALTYFSGGAAAGALGSSGGGAAAGGATAASAAPAASGAAGAAGGAGAIGAAGSAAITPAFASGAAGAGAGAGVAGSTTGSLIGASALTPAFASGAIPGITGAAGLGTLGTAGTSAATAALTPGFASLGSVAPSFASKAYNFGKQANEYRGNIEKLRGTETGPTDQQRSYKAANDLAFRILKSGEKAPNTSTAKKITNELFNRRLRGGY